MTPGLALFYGGMSGRRQVLNMMMMSFGVMAVVPVIYVLWGWSMSYGYFHRSHLRRTGWPCEVLRVALVCRPVNHHRLLPAGTAAMVLALVVGKRAGFPGKFARPHNLPLVMFGAALLWFGWLGFNGGSAFAADSVSPGSWPSLRPPERRPR